MGRPSYLNRILMAGLLATLAAVMAAPASAALPGLQLVAQGSGASSENKGARVDCPEGQDHYGVGAKVSDGQNQVMLDALEVGLGGAVKVHASEDQDGTNADWSVRAYAVCADASLSGGAIGRSFPFPDGDSSSPKSVTSPQCVDERRLTGASGALLGAAGDDPPGEVLLAALIPSADLESATARAYEDQNGTNADWQILGEALCSATTLPGLERVAATGPTNSQDKHATARCPEGKRVVGTGGEIIGGEGQVGITYLLPDDDLTRVHVRGAEDQDGTSADWAVRAYAVCATP
jgi:hypothetical protein